MRDEACGGIPRLWIGISRIGNGAEHELVVGRVEGIGGGSGIMLKFLVAPAVGAVAELLVEVLADRARGEERWLPIVGGVAGSRLLWLA